MAGTVPCVRHTNQPKIRELLRYTDPKDYSDFFGVGPEVKKSKGGRPKDRIENCMIAIATLYPDGKRDGSWNAAQSKILEFMETDLGFDIEVSESTIKSAFKEYQKVQKHDQKPQ